MNYKRRVVALCTSRVYDPQVYSYIVKINECLAPNNCSVVIYAINSDLYWDDNRITAEAAVFDIIAYDAVDAVILMDEKIKSHGIAHKIINESKAHNKPVIVVDGEYDDVYCVKFDYGAGFEEVVRHVMNVKDIKKPHIMAGIENNFFSDQRIDIFKKVIKEYGITFDDSMLSYGQFWAGPAKEETEKIIASGELPDAIICANDIMAINVCDVLKSHGYSIPEDILVSGFDGFEETYITTPKVTTVSCATSELAKATADLVLRLDEHPEEQKIYVVPTLITNESTGCESQSHANFMLDHFNNSFYRHHDGVRAMYELYTAMQMSRSEGEMLSYLANLSINGVDVIKETAIVFNKNLFDKDEYFFNTNNGKVDVSDYQLEFDCNICNELIKTEASETFLNPDSEEFMLRTEAGYPLIINAVDYTDIPMGFICFNYKYYDATRYSRTANLTTTISTGIGGYINTRYLENLAVKINDMYKTDPLTGLYSRIGFNNAFDNLKKGKGLIGKPVTLIMVDLDGLKYINDNFGHDDGDNAISVAAKALKKACPKEALCVRFGGDELFAVVFGECDNNKIMKKMENYLDKYNQTSDKEYSVVASCGFNTTTFDEKFDIKDALRIADEQMYNIKKSHKR